MTVTSEDELSQLTDTQRGDYVAVVVKGESTSERAEERGVTQPAVQQNVTKAKKNLRGNEQDEHSTASKKRRSHRGIRSENGLIKRRDQKFVCGVCGERLSNVSRGYDPTGKKALIWAECNPCGWGFGPFTGKILPEETDKLLQTTAGEFDGRGRDYTTKLHDCPECGASRLNIKKESWSKRFCRKCGSEFIEAGKGVLKPVFGFDLIEP